MKLTYSRPRDEHRPRRGRRRPLPVGRGLRRLQRQRPVLERKTGGARQIREGSHRQDQRVQRLLLHRRLHRPAPLDRRGERPADDQLRRQQKFVLPVFRHLQVERGEKGPDDQRNDHLHRRLPDRQARFDQPGQRGGALPRPHDADARRPAALPQDGIRRERRHLLRLAGLRRPQKPALLRRGAVELQPLRLRSTRAARSPTSRCSTSRATSSRSGRRWPSCRTRTN